MLNVTPGSVDFLVTANMADEAQRLLDDQLPLLDAWLAEVSTTIDRIYFVASGSPLCAGQTAQILCERYSGFPARAISAAAFAVSPPAALSARSLVVAISDSGTTAEVADATRLARAAGARTLAVTKTATNPVAHEAEKVLAYEGDCIWVLHVLTCYYLVLKLMGDRPEVDTIAADLPKIPALLRELVARCEPDSKAKGISASHWPFIYTVTSGNLLPLGYKEGIITMLEFTWTHGCSLDAAEFRHGPLEVVEEGVPYIFLLGTDAARPLVERAIAFVASRTKNTLVFDAAELNTGLHAAFDPIALFVPLEFFYYWFSLAKDHNPDDRRYYGGLAAY